MSPRTVRLLVLAMVFMVAGNAWADQTLTLKDKPKVLEASITYDNFNSAAARRLVLSTFPDANVEDPGFYCVIHLVNWGTDPTVVASSKWFVYRGKGSQMTPGGPWTATRFAGNRLFGTDQLRFVYVHFNVPAKAAKDVEAPKIKAIRDAEDAPKSKRQQPLAIVDNFVVEQDYLGVAYQIDVIKKLPAPIQNLTNLIGLLQSAAADANTIDLTDHVMLYGAGEYDIVDVPSDIKISGMLTITSDISKPPTKLGDQTYDNEGLYRWDVSVGIPLTSVTQVDFETSGGDVFAKKVDEAKLLVMLNLYITPVDTKDTRKLLFPRPLVGVGFSTKPLERLFVGASMGLNRAQVFGGVLWTQVPEAPSTTGVDTSQHLKYDWHLVAGLNVTTRQLVDFMKAKK